MRYKIHTDLFSVHHFDHFGLYVLHSQEEQRCLMLEEKRQKEVEFHRTELLQPEMRQKLDCESNEQPQNGFSPSSMVCVQ